MKSLTVFYADDDQDDIEYFSEALKDINEEAKLFALNKADQLIEALHNPPPTPNIVFLDLNMPGKNGFDALQEIRVSGKHPNVPVVIFSTSTDEENIERSFQLGANYYLPKSSTYNSLKKSLKDILSIDWANFKTTKENFLYTSN